MVREYTIHRHKDDLYVAMAHDGSEHFEGDYFGVLCDLIDSPGFNEGISIEISKEDIEFPSKSTKRLTQRIIEMYNKLARMKNTLTHQQLKLKIKD